MTDYLFHFFPYSRRGAAAFVDNADPVWRPTTSRPLKITRTLAGGETSTEDIQHPLEILGPGDAIGFDRGEILRMSPPPGSDVASANYLAHIEFAHPDLPWLFTPLKSKDQLPPWIALIVIEQGGNAPKIRPASPNPTITVSPDELPDLADSWAWAHVHVTAGLDDDVSAVLQAGRAQSKVSRLICPRHLEPHRDYVACVVPTYDPGRIAGLGILTEPGGRAEGAWKTDAAGPVTLPVYHHWYFRTGPAGDFETLAQRLQAFDPVNTQVGRRTVLVGPKVSRLPKKTVFPPRVLEMETAVASKSKLGPFSPLNRDDVEGRAELQKSLQKLVNLDTAKDEADGKIRQVVGPPLYGKWHARTKESVYDPDTQAPPAGWLDEINLDPEMRAAAALGTRVVQMDQESLMADAWRQLQAVEEGNRLARWAQVYMIASIKMHEKRLAKRSPTNVLRLANPALGRLHVDKVTVANTLAATALPQVAISANFARSTRYATRALARSGQPDLSASIRVMTTVVPKMLGGGALFSPRFKPSVYLEPTHFKELFVDASLRDQVTQSLGGPSFDGVADQVAGFPAIIRTIRDTIKVAPEHNVRVSPEAARPEHGGITRGQVIIQQIEHPGVLVGQGITTTAIQPTVTVTADQFSLLKARTHTRAFRARNRVQLLNEGDGLQEALAVDRAAIPVLMEQNPAIEAALSTERLVVSDLTDQRFDIVASMVTADADTSRSFREFARVKSALNLRLNPATDFSASPVLAELGDEGAAIFKTMPQEMTLAEQRASFPPVVQVDPDTIKAQVVALLEPVRRYEKMLDWAIPIGDGRQIGQPRRRSPAHQIMFAPQFPQPMYDRLRRLDSNWVLGHGEQLPNNSISIFVSNARFVEAFLVGANYEMMRELQWRRYPTDLMGTCFTRFWSAASEDIVPIHLWNQPLGKNSPAGDEHPGDDTVVVIRGDLLRLYPNADVVAVRGKIDNGRLIAAETKPPSYRQTLGTDMTLAGFNMSRDTLKGGDEEDCWYIALTQPADEPKFGLDQMDVEDGAVLPPPKAANEMSWQNMMPQTKRGHLVAHLPIQGQPPGGWNVKAPATKAKWGEHSDAGQIAALLYQRPFQVLLKASDYIV